MGMAKRLLGAGLVCAALAYGCYERDMVSEYLNDTNTTREQLIESSILRAFDVSTDVRCVSKEKMDNLFNPGDRGRAIPIMGMIWLKEEICQYVEAFKDKPYSWHASVQQIDALETVTHESMHIERMDWFSASEGKMECYAAQVTYKLAGSLGADQENALRIGRAAAEQVRKQTDLPAEYNLSSECRPGGAEDLGDPHRIFP